ncbi:MAG: spore maturation protein [Clostridiales bacterium]|nr:spore maturation protein [Clostridiales bacterium]
MKLILFLSEMIVPATAVSILLFGYFRNVKLWPTFLKGAKEGLLTVFDILPALIGLMVAVSVLRASGFLDFLVKLLLPIAQVTGFPVQTVPLAMMRLVSSSAASGMLIDIFQVYGPDSFVGRLSSVMMSCTETVFYTISIYFFQVKASKTRYIIPGALLANGAGLIASFFICQYLWK